MADEITVSARLAVAKGSIALDMHPASITPDMAGTRYLSTVKAVGFAAHEKAFESDDLGTEGWFYFRNLDATNFIRLGLDVGAVFCPFAKLLPGEMGLFRLAPGVDLYAQADTAAVNLEYLALEA